MYFFQIKFIEVSHLSFVHGIGPKLKEGVVKKRSGDREVATGCCSCWGRCVKNATAHWNKRYISAMTGVYTFCTMSIWA